MQHYAELGVTRCIILLMLAIQIYCHYSYCILRLRVDAGELCSVDDWPFRFNRHGTWIGWS